MSTPPQNPGFSANDMRQRAEAVFRDSVAPPPENLSELSHEENQALVYELRVHQIQMEMQNEELRSAQIRLENSQQRYFELYDLAPVGYCTVDQQGLVQESNLAAATLLGVPRGNLVGTSLHRAIHKEDADNFYLLCKRLLETSDPQECDLRMVRQGGMPFCAHLRTTIAKSEDSGPLIRIVITDISARQKLMTELREASLYSRSLLESSLDPLVTISLEGRISDVNSATERVTGLGREMLIGSDFADYFTDPEMARAGYMKVFSDGQVIDYPLAIRHASGAITDVLYNASVYRNEQGEVLGVFAAARDITERKKVEEERAEVMSRLTKIANQVPGVVYQYRLRPDGTSCFPYASEGIREIYGVSPEEVCEDASKVFAVLHPADADGIVDSIKKSAQDLEPWHHEYRVLFGDGKMRWVLGNALPQREADGSTLWHGFITDITERKHADLKLRAALTEAQGFRQALDHVSAFIYIKDLQSRYVYANQPTLKLFGCSAEELTGCDDTRFFPPDTVKQLREIDGRVFLGEHTAQEIVLAGNGGRSVAYWEIKSPFYEAHEPQTIVGLIGISTDITERKQMEEDRDAALSLLTSIAKQVPGLVYQFLLRPDGSSCLPYASEAFREMFALTPEEVLEDASKVFARVIPADLAGLNASIQQAALDLSPWQHDFRVRRDDGSVRWLSGNSRPQRKADGSTLSSGYMADITERKLAEVALSETQERLALAMDQSQLAYWEMDAATKTFTFNDRYYNLHGTTAEREGGYQIPVDVAIRELLPPEDQRLVAESILGGVSGEATELQLEHRILRRDGKLRHVLVRINMIRDNTGRITGARGSNLDITERKQMEEALEKKTAEMERFTYTVSHDLKSPLVTIKTFLGFLEKDLTDQNAEHLSRDLGFIHGAADKMGDLLNELLKLARVGYNRNDIVQVPLQEVVQEALFLVAGQIAERGVQVQVTQDPVWLTGDRVRLVEVFQNLIDNAVKFLGDEPAPRVEIGVEVASDENVIFVRDNGKGIGLAYQPKVFALFHQIDDCAPGSGLGLALVRRIVELHGGKIWVESDGLGHGSTFRFTLAKTQLRQQGPAMSPHLK